MHNKYVDLQALGPKIQGQICAKGIYISKNAKTGVSVNSRIEPCKIKINGLIFSLPGTCEPTDWCKKHCYARHGHFAKVGGTQDENGVQQTRYLINNLLFQHYENAPQIEVDVEADHVVGKAMAEGCDNIRWNGGGDLSPGAVRIINSVTERHPDFRVWVFTRRADLARDLTLRPNLFPVFSMDPTTPPVGAWGYQIGTLIDAAQLLGGRMAYVAENPDDRTLAGESSISDTLRISKASLDVVFGYHKGPKHTQLDHPLECPSTAQVEGAGCQTCRWCFMTDEEREGEKVKSPKEAFSRHLE